MSSSFFKTAQEKLSTFSSKVADTAKKMVDAVDYLKQNQPIHITGILPAVYAWLVSSFHDQHIINKKFNPNTPADEERVIFAVHGTADRNGRFTKFSERIIDFLPDCFREICQVTFDYRGMGKGIEDFAQQLFEKMLGSEKKHFVLMGHSRGGLVISYLKEYYAEQLKAAGIEIDLVIPMAAPLWGSWLAWPPLTWFSKSVCQMKIGSDFLRALRSKIYTSEKIQDKYYYVICGLDHIVYKNAAYIQHFLNGKPNRLLLTRHGHLSGPSSHIFVKSTSELFAERYKDYATDKIPDNEILSPDTALLENDIEYIQVRSHELIEDISMCIHEVIIELTSRLHIFSVQKKVDVLTNLQEQLWELRDGVPPEEAKECKTVGEFIYKKLYKPDVTTGVKPVDVLSAHLNFNLAPLKKFVTQPISSIKNLFTPTVPTLSENIKEHDEEDWTALTREEENFQSLFSELKPEAQIEEEAKAASYVFVRELMHRYKDEPLPVLRCANEKTFELR